MIYSFAHRPLHKSRYQTGDIVKTNKNARGRLSRYGNQPPVDLPAEMQGSVMEVAPYRTDDSYPPAWIYRVRFGEDKYWVRGGMLSLVERNPALKKQQPKKKKTIRRKL